MMIAYSQRLSRAPSKSGLLATGESLPRACAPFRHTNALGFAIVDDRFRFIAINGVMAAMNGIAPEAHVGCELRKVLGAAAEKIEAVSRNVVATARALPPFELVATLPTRSEPGNWIEVYFPLRGKSGRVTRVGAIAVEITRQRYLEKILCALHGGLLRARGHKARVLSRDLHAAVNGYHASLAMSLGHLSQQLQKGSVDVSALVTLLDKRLLKVQGLIDEVAQRFRFPEQQPTAVWPSAGPQHPLVAGL